MRVVKCLRIGIEDDRSKNYAWVGITGATVAGEILVYCSAQLMLVFGLCNLLQSSSLSRRYGAIVLVFLMKFRFNNFQMECQGVFDGYTVKPAYNGTARKRNFF